MLVGARVSCRPNNLVGTVTTTGSAKNKQLGTVHCCSPYPSNQQEEKGEAEANDQESSEEKKGWQRAGCETDMQIFVLEAGPISTG